MSVRVERVVDGDSLEVRETGLVLPTHTGAACTVLTPRKPSQKFGLASHAALGPPARTDAVSSVMEVFAHDRYARAIALLYWRDTTAVETP